MLKMTEFSETFSEERAAGTEVRPPGLLRGFFLPLRIKKTFRVNIPIAYWSFVECLLQYNSNLYHMAMEIAPEQAKERMQESDPTFCNAVATMLQATRLTVFS